MMYFIAETTDCLKDAVNASHGTESEIVFFVPLNIQSYVSKML
jgi:hypothetical protein